MMQLPVVSCLGYLILVARSRPLISGANRPHIHTSTCCSSGCLAAMSQSNDGIQCQLVEAETGDTASTPFKFTHQPEDFTGLPLPVTQANTADSGRQKAKRARVRGLRMYWECFMKRMGTESPPSSSAFVDSTCDSGPRLRTDGTDVDEVDEIVVDRDWTEDMKNSPDHSEYAPDNSGDSHMAHVGAGTGTSVGHESTSFPDDGGFLRQFLILLRWEVWPAVHKFVHVRFNDEKTEERYQGERWCIRKVLCLLNFPATRLTFCSAVSCLVGHIFHRKLGYRSSNNCRAHHRS